MGGGENEGKGLAAEWAKRRRPLFGRDSQRQGFEVTSHNADSPPSPAGYGVVIFNNVERSKFTRNYLAAIERHTAQGNGFLMLGSDASFGPGTYSRTPIEAILPVEPKEPKREEKNRAI